MKSALKFIIKYQKLIAIGYTILLFVLVSMPSEELPGNVDDKTAHLVSFAILAFLWLSIASNNLVTILICIAFGLFIEFWQAILPESFHRSFDWYDALADAIGVGIGSLLFFLRKKFFFN